MSKGKQEKRVKELYLINIESHLVSLLELLADNKLLIVSGTIVSVEDCLDKIKLNIQSQAEANNDDFLTFLFSQTALTHNRISQLEKEADTLRISLESLRKQRVPNNNQQIDDLEDYLGSGEGVTRQKFKSNEEDKERIEDLRIAINQLKQNEIKLMQEISNKEKQARREKSLATDMKVEVESLNELVKRLQNENNKYTSKLYESNQNLDQAKRENQELKNRMNGFSIKQAEENLEQIIQRKETVLIENQNQRLKNQITMVKEQLKYYQIKYQDAVDISSQELQHFKALADERLRELNRASIQVSSLEEASVDLAAENQEFKEMVRRSNENLLLAQTRCYELERQLTLKEEIERQISQIRIQNEFLKQELFEEKQKNQNLELITYDKNQKHHSHLTLQNQELKKELERLRSQTKCLSQNTISKFSDMVKTLKQKHNKKCQLFKKALGKVVIKFSKVRETHNSIKEELRNKLKSQLLTFQTFIKQELLGYKQKYLLYKKMNQEQQYQRHLSLLKQIDIMREDVETKHVKVSEQENRVLEILKRENDKLFDHTLLRVKSQDYLVRTKPSYINRF